MKLITFQSLEAFKELKEKGILRVPDLFSNANSKKYDILSSHQMEEVDIESFDHLKLHGFYYHTEKPKGTAIIFHGYKSGPFADESVFAGDIIQRGFDVLLVCHTYQNLILLQVLQEHLFPCAFALIKK